MPLDLCLDVLTGFGCLVLESCKGHVTNVGFYLWQANCIDSTVPAEAVFAQEVKKLQKEQFKPSEQVTLEPFERDHACVVGGYRMPKKVKPGAGS